MGKFMYDITVKAGLFLDKHIWLYYLLNFTWGIFITFCGLIMTLALLIVGKKPHSFHTCWYFTIGKSWGGFEMGLAFLRDNSDYQKLNNHELGHSYQNAIYGPFTLFIITIPSIIRYWYRRITKNFTKDYDAIWFEGSATEIGLRVMEEK